MPTTRRAAHFYDRRMVASSFRSRRRLSVIAHGVSAHVYVFQNPFVFSVFTQHIRTGRGSHGDGRGRCHRFQPESLTINAGDTVTFVNGGGFHNVVADDNSFTSGPPSDTFHSRRHSRTQAHSLITAKSTAVQEESACPDRSSSTPRHHGGTDHRRDHRIVVRSAENRDTVFSFKSRRRIFSSRIGLSSRRTERRKHG